MDVSVGLVESFTEAPRKIGVTGKRLAHGPSKVLPVQARSSTHGVLLSAKVIFYPLDQFGMFDQMMAIITSKIQKRHCWWSWYRLRFGCGLILTDQTYAQIQVVPVLTFSLEFRYWSLGSPILRVTLGRPT